MTLAYAVVFAFLASACSSLKETQQESNSLVFSYRFNSGDVYPNSTSYLVYQDRTVLNVHAGLASDRVEIRQAELTESELAQLKSSSKELGLASTDGLNLGEPDRTLGLVSYYFRHLGKEYRHAFQYAHSSDSNLTNSQATNRKKLRKQLSTKLGNKIHESGEPYQAGRVAILTRPSAESGQRDVLEWTLEPLRKAKRWKLYPNRDWDCMILPQAKAEGLIAKEERAQRIAERRGPGGLVEVNPLYRSGGKLYDVRFHPLLPDESDCSSVQPYFVPPAGVDSGQ